MLTPHLKKIFWCLSVLAITIATQSSGMAAQSKCPEHFAIREAPDILNQALKTNTRELCYSGFAVLHSGVTRSPIFSAEHLTNQRVLAAQKLPRKDSFHPELHLAPTERGELNDYSHSGFDRGHMSPNKDMSDEKMQEESFSLANIVPQNPSNNQVLHEGIEEVTRILARTYDEIYVVTGPAYIGSTINKIGNVIVPTHIWKAIYIPSQSAAAAYWENNAPGMNYEIISINELKNRTGVDVFPNLPNQIKANAVKLPVPHPHNSH